MIDDRELDAALRALPGAGASPGFTARVLARTVAAPARSAVRPRLAVGLAAVAATLALALGGAALDAHLERQAVATQAAAVAALQAEHERLAAELALLRRTAMADGPLFRVGAAEGFEVLLDFSDRGRDPGPVLASDRSTRTASAGAVRPAVLRSVY